VRIKRPLLVVAILISMHGCDSTEGAIADQNRLAVEAELKERLESLKTAWLNLDAKAVVAHYADTGIDTYNGDRASAKQLYAWAETGYQDLAKTEIGPFQNLRIDVLARDAAVTSWENRFTETNAAGVRQPETLALMTQVWIRESGQWLILHNHESTQPAPDFAGSIDDDRMNSDHQSGQQR
jgi:ketosteroid isomerase-like protein